MEENVNLMENVAMDQNELTDEKLEQFAIGCLRFAVEYNELGTQEEKDAFIKEAGEDFYQQIMEFATDDLDDDDKHDARVLIEELLSMFGRVMSRVSDKARGKAVAFLNEHDVD